MKTFWKLFVFVALFFILPFFAFAEELKLCRSPYALQSKNFNYSEYVKQTKDVGNYVVTWLFNSFGDDFKNPKAELARPVVTGTEVAFLNTTCLNNKNCAKYEILSGYTNDSFGKAIDKNDAKLWAKIDPQAKKLADFLIANLRAEQTCKISPFLEGKLSRARYQKFANHILPFFQGRCEFVWNPQGGNPGAAQAPAVITEGHGDSPKLSGRCIANPDGTTIPDGDYPGYLSKYGSKCEQACTWGPNDNCRSSDSPTNQDPRGRTCKDTKDFKKANTAMKAARKMKPVPPWTAEDDKSLVGCEKVRDPNDGAKKGFLSKASDDIHYYAWTVLFPPVKNSAGKFIEYKKVESWSKGKAFWPWARKGLYTEDGSSRSTWRACVKDVPLQGCKNPIDAPKNVVIRASLDGKTKWQCWKIADPAIRND